MTDYIQRLHDSARALPEIADRIVSYAHEVNSAALLVCDRNARPIGYAIDRLLAERGDDTDLPRMYVRISDRVGQAVVNRMVADEIERGHIDAGPGESIVVIDEHVSKGSTMRMASIALHLVMPEVSSRFVTMTGKGADLVLRPSVGPNIAAPWRDMTESIGYEYSERETAVTAAPTERSAAFYSVIDHATTEYLCAGS